jgi:molybdenum cofactor synthesis domain-containing protein
MTSGATIPISSDATINVNIELLSIGNELLSGTIANKNAQWISSKITQAGGLVKRITTIGDSISEISAAAKESIQRSPDWLIVSGGLGPTYDDKTLQGLSIALGQELALDPEALEMLRKSYARNPFTRNYELNDIRLKMARIPRGSVPIQNPVGSAPSVIIKNTNSDNPNGKTRIVCLPGVPKEMKAIFSNTIMPQLKITIGDYFFTESFFETIGISESMLAPTLSSIVDSYPVDAVYLKTHPRGYRLETSNKHKIKPKLNIQIVSKGKEKEKVKKRYNDILDALKSEIGRLGGKIYLTNIKRKKSDYL